jgi:hypothetical protein
MQQIQLIKRAVILFPRTDYTDRAAVQHARRQWLKSVAMLRSRNGWILDHPVERRQ